MGQSNPDSAEKRSLTSDDGFSALPEVDMRNDRDLQGKELRSVDGKEVISRDIGGLEVLPEKYGKHSHVTGIEVAGADEKESL